MLIHTSIQIPNIKFVSPRFDIAKRSKSILPLENTITNGHFVDGHIIGVDEGDAGVYFAIIDPDTGKTVAKNVLGKVKQSFNF